ncbi:MAG: hypothetical protein AUK21_02490 [Parcubacteria group bacterium CG2_30_48_51]|nr:MAG: hypothetical protein AUK21_02490 [Parcubacteria group bacterium CG2_30_48_51]
MKIAIIGNPNSIKAFIALGVETFPIITREEGVDVLERIAKRDDLAAVFITENWAEELREALVMLESRALPAVVAIPSQLGPTGEGMRRLKRIVEQAVGSDILQT